MLFSYSSNSDLQQHDNARTNFICFKFIWRKKKQNKLKEITTRKRKEVGFLFASHKQNTDGNIANMAQTDNIDFSEHQSPVGALYVKDELRLLLLRECTPRNSEVC